MMQWYTVDNNLIDFTTTNKLLASDEAAKLTVETIINHYPPPYHLMVSGGVDSQAMLYAWKLYGRDYIPTSVVYNNGMNMHDLETLAIFVDREKIYVKYIDFDLLKFYETEYDDLCETYKCISPHFGAHLGMTKNLTGTCIFSGDCLGVKSAALRNNNLCLLRASKERSIVPYFFLHTPEIAYCINYHRYIAKDLNFSSTNFLYETKVRIWTTLGFPVIAQTQKFTGFEKIKDYYDETYGHLITPEIRLRYANKASNRTYDLLLRYPYEEKYGNPEYKYILNEIR